jgi:hypothetical protein
MYLMQSYSARERISKKRKGSVMSRSFIVRLSAAALGAAIGALTFVVFPVFASNPTSATTTPVVSPANTIANPVTPNSPYFIYFLLILLGFGLLSIGGMLLYIYRIQLKYYSAAQKLSRIGEGVKAVSIRTFAGTHLTGNKPPDQKSGLHIDGPGFVTIGTQTSFKVTDVAKKSPATNAQWSVTPDNIAGLSSTTGEQITILPMSMGSFHLSAETPDPDGKGDTVLVAAVAPQTATEELPFIGQSYGTLALTILVVVAVIVLALTGALSIDAVATLLGGLIGYIFGVTTSTVAGTSAAKSSGKSSNASN